MSAITSGRETRAGRDDARTNWEREMGLPLAAARSWTAARHQQPSGQAGSAAAQPTNRGQRRAFLSVGLLLWLVVYTLLNIGDLLSTYFGLQAGLHEANPLMSGLLVQSGFGSLIVYKLVVIVGVIVGAIALYRMHPRAAFVTVHICNILVFLAVLLNVMQMVLR